jgi:hypothetical protein
LAGDDLACGTPWIKLNFFALFSLIGKLGLIPVNPSSALHRKENRKGLTKISTSKKQNADGGCKQTYSEYLTGPYYMCKTII